MIRDLSPYKILVVDGEPDTRAFICTVLADNGATVLEASDGDAALNKLESYMGEAQSEGREENQGTIG